MGACGVEVARRASFEARVRHLQRLGLPDRGEVKSHSRYAYGLAELAGIATALRLIDAFMPPTLAVRHVAGCWAALAPCLAAGAGDEAPAGYWGPHRPAGGTLAVIAGAGLADIGTSAAHERRYAGPLGTVRVFGGADATAGLAAATGGAGVLLDAGAYMPVLLASLRAVDLVTEEDLADELDRLRAGAVVS